MADVYLDSNAANGGSGSINSPLNSFAAITWGSNRYQLKRGSTFRETLTLSGASGGSTFTCYGDPANPLPVIDCENTRNNGIDLQSKTNCVVENIRIINQNAAVPNGGVRVTGSGHTIRFMEFAGCRISIHCNSSNNNRIYSNTLDVGNRLALLGGYGIRLNGTCSGNEVYNNTLTSTCFEDQIYVVDAIFLASIEIYQGTSNRIYANDVRVPFADGPTLYNANNNEIFNNFVGCEGMLDGIDVYGSDNALVYNNTVIQYRTWANHDGPCFAMTDASGALLYPNNCTIKNNLFYANDKLCMRVDMRGTGNTFVTNNHWRIGSGDGIINLEEGSGLTTTNIGTWQGKSYVTGDTSVDPQILEATGGLLQASPMIGAGTHIKYMRDIRGAQRRRPPAIGAFDATTLRRVLLADPAA